MHDFKFNILNHVKALWPRALKTFGFRLMFIYLFPVSNSNNEHNKSVVLNSAYDSVIPNSIAP